MLIKICKNTYIYCIDSPLNIVLNLILRHPQIRGSRRQKIRIQEDKNKGIQAANIYGSKRQKIRIQAAKNRIQAAKRTDPCGKNMYLGWEKYGSKRQKGTDPGGQKYGSWRQWQKNTDPSVK